MWLSSVFFVIFANIMPNTFFRFKKFIVHQEHCAMKVGTDGVLLGAWARGGGRILDIGTGTGLVALMMAQRFPHAQVDAIDIDADACSQAVDNVEASPFAENVKVECLSVQRMAGDERRWTAYDAVVSNPPFFENALKAPALARNRARHNDTLPYDELFAAVRRLISSEGQFSVIIPFDYRGRLEQEAALWGFHLVRRCAIRTTPAKQPKRYLLAFCLQAGELETSEGVLEVQPGVRSEWYRQLTGDFYL